MSIKVMIAAPLFQEITRGKEVIEVNGGSTFQEVLDKIEAQYPGLKKKMYINGELSGILDVFVNGESVFPNELTTKVSEGDEIWITMLYEGG